MANSVMLEYVRNAQERLAPSEKTGASGEMLEQLQKRLEQIKKNDLAAEIFCDRTYEQRENHIKIEEMTVTMFLLTCAPFAIWIPYMNMAGDLGAFGWLLYLPSLAALLARAYFLDKEKYPFSIPAWIGKIAIMVGCALAGGVLQIRLLGTTTAWIAVYIVAGTALTVIVRIKGLGIAESEMRRFQRGNQEQDEYEKQLLEAADLFVKLGECYEKRMEAIGGKESIKYMQRNPRRAWFLWKREYGGRREGIRKPQPRHVGTSFAEPFKGHDFAEEDGTVIHSYDVHSEQFGWNNITVASAKELIYSGALIPFFSLGVPIFDEEWSYRILRHTWDVTETVERYYTFTETKKVDSEIQKEFDRKTTLFEDTVLGPAASIENLQWGSDVELAALAEQYAEKKREKRESLGSRQIENTVRRKDTKQYRRKGDEIGTLLILDAEGELIGAYCGDSQESLECTMEHVRRKRNFVLTPAVQAQGSSQIAYMYRRFFR